MYKYSVNFELIKVYVLFIMGIGLFKDYLISVVASSYLIKIDIA